MLICNAYSGGRADASTFDGLTPFTAVNDLSTPNEAYFARCDQIIRAAAHRGINVILDPVDTGGFMPVLRQNGLDKCRAYGRYLGDRYKDFDNIVWMSGSDFQSWRTASDNALVKAVADGIRETDSRHIHTLQLDYFVSSSLDNSAWSGLVTLNAAYTYYPAYAEVLEGYNRVPAVPVFLIESDYEGENGADAERLRRQEYWSLLSGACGHVFGNAFVWPITTGWEDNLDTPGVVQFGYCRDLFAARPWHSLVPDQTHVLVTAGYGTFWSGGDAEFRHQRERLRRGSLHARWKARHRLHPHVADDHGRHGPTGPAASRRAGTIRRPGPPKRSPALPSRTTAPGPSRLPASTPTERGTGF